MKLFYDEKGKLNYLNITIKMFQYLSSFFQIDEEKEDDQINSNHEENKNEYDTDFPKDKKRQKSKTPVLPNNSIFTNAKLKRVKKSVRFTTHLSKTKKRNRL
jgi:hypothetical protein